ncbi:hypothetical protein CDL15_Pgr006467 [Punica granatum]|uniref:Uncharacterized protein n=1 Tax=Punica granatum TaxID=22663 RepID=A0A218XZS4_PUNGR|nr:hypothetical protein CDL15_Pgr006467 [Punica granatum]PKI41280.1 hypothetical protein CRG98_038330 [Punica granatum]
MAFHVDLVLIGPYHGRGSWLQVGQLHKKQFLMEVVNGKGATMDDLFQAIAQYDALVRAYYHDISPKCDIPSDEFINMMVTHGCFIVEFMLQHHLAAIRGLVVDQMLADEGVLRTMCNDPLVLDNQLPFFVLQRLFEMTRDINEEKPPLKEL